MMNTDLYSIGPDGTLWTRYNGNERRPATAGELEGYCLERASSVTPFPKRPQPADPVPVPLAVRA